MLVLHPKHDYYPVDSILCLQVENQMVSAERVLAYCKVDQEASLESSPENKPADDWPTKGNIEASRLNVFRKLFQRSVPVCRMDR